MEGQLSEAEERAATAAREHAAALDVAALDTARQVSMLARAGTPWHPVAPPWHPPALA